MNINKVDGWSGIRNRRGDFLVKGQQQLKNPPALLIVTSGGKDNGVGIYRVGADNGSSAAAFSAGFENIQRVILYLCVSYRSEKMLSTSSL